MDIYRLRREESLHIESCLFSLLLVHSGVASREYLYAVASHFVTVAHYFFSGIHCDLFLIWVSLFMICILRVAAISLQLTVFFIGIAML